MLSSGIGISNEISWLLVGMKLETLEGSFSAVSKPIFASKDSAIDYFRVLPKWQNSEVIDDAVFSYQIVPSLREGQKAA